jgi:hypothetical protein
MNLVEVIRRKGPYLKTHATRGSFMASAKGCHRVPWHEAKRNDLLGPSIQDNSKGPKWLSAGAFRRYILELHVRSQQDQGHQMSVPRASSRTPHSSLDPDSSAVSAPVAKSTLKLEDAEAHEQLEQNTAIGDDSFHYSPFQVRITGAPEPDDWTGRYLSPEEDPFETAPAFSTRKQKRLRSFRRDDYVRPSDQT